MFITKKTIEEMIAGALKVFKQDEFIKTVKCEHTKLYGAKEDMVERTVRFMGCRFDGIRFHRGTNSKTVYFSPAFAPKWDIKDETDPKNVKYYKKVEAKEVEVKL